MLRELAPAPPVAARAPDLATFDEAASPALGFHGGGRVDPAGAQAAFGHFGEAASPIDQVTEAADLPAAMAELSDKFQISETPGGPNNVTPEQFRDIASLYSRIRLGHTDIVFDGDAPELQQAAMGDIAKMMQTGAGRELLGRLADNTHTELGPEGQELVEHRKTHIGLADPESHGSTGFGPTDMDVEEQQQRERQRYNGVGNDARVRYHPGQGFHEIEADGDRVEYTGDITLFHELAHAYHETTGTVARGVVSPDEAAHELDVGLDREEYYTTGLGDDALGYLSENQYRFERSRMGEDVRLRDQYLANQRVRDAYFARHP